MRIMRIIVHATAQLTIGDRQCSATDYNKDSAEEMPKDVWDKVKQTLA